MHSHLFVPIIISTVASVLTIIFGVGTIRSNHRIMKNLDRLEASLSGEATAD